MRNRLSILLSLIGILSIGSPALAARAGEPEILRVVRIIHGPSALDSFRRPTAIVSDSTRGMFVIADTGNHRLAIFDDRFRSRGLLAADAGGPGASAGEPKALAIDARARLVVVDDLRNDVEVMTPRGGHLASIVPRLDPEDPLPLAPQDVALGSSGRLYILCGGKRPGVLVTRRDGTPVSRIGFDGPPDACLVRPVAVAVNRDESLIVVLDTGAEHPVRVYRPNGTLVTAFGDHKEGVGGFSLPVDVVWGPRGALWITDTIRHSISVFDDRGTFLGRIGGFGTGPGQFNYPVGCAFLATDRIAVLERAGARCQVLQVALPTLDTNSQEFTSAGQPDLITRIRKGGKNK